MQSAVSSAAPRRRGGRSFVLVAFLLALAFGAGYVPQWMQNRKLRATLETTDLQLRLANVHRLIGVASHEAQRNNFAAAAAAASRFFDDCAALANTAPFTEEPRTRIALLGYAGQRDAIMRMLSAGDPAARERLAQLYLTMEGVIARRGGSEIEN